MAEASFQNYIEIRKDVFLSIKKGYAEIYGLNKMIQLKKKILRF